VLSLAVPCRAAGKAAPRGRSTRKQQSATRTPAASTADKIPTSADTNAAAAAAAAAASTEPDSQVVAAAVAAGDKDPAAAAAAAAAVHDELSAGGRRKRKDSGQKRERGKVGARTKHS